MSKLKTCIESIDLNGIRQNNLKNIHATFPKEKLTVVTGLSGSGKSSLVFDTLHAEGQRRYVETFSPYTRQFLDTFDRPEVDQIENILPSIAIEQGNQVRTSRSTVGTITQLCDFMKVWFAYVSELYDPQTNKVIKADSPPSIWQELRQCRFGETILLTFRIEKPQNITWEMVLNSLRKQGYSRYILDGKSGRLEGLRLTKEHKHIQIIEDRLRIIPKNETRFLQSCKTALHFGKGRMSLYDDQSALIKTVSTFLESPASGQIFQPSSPSLFSFNSPIGACPTCKGFGKTIENDYAKIIPDPSLSIEEGAIRPFQGEIYSKCQRDLMLACKHYGIPTNQPYHSISSPQQNYIINGEKIYIENKNWYGIRRFFDWLNSKTYKMHLRVFLSKYRSYRKCPDCHGTRLIEEARYWKFQGYRLPDLYRMPIDQLYKLIKAHPLSEMEASTGLAYRSDEKSSGRSAFLGRDQSLPSTQISPSNGNKQLQIAYDAILNRLRYLCNVGLGYLNLDRPSKTLSGGEVERVNLTASLGTGLSDTLFVLDEPSVGMHARDVHRLIHILRELTSMGNTVVVVEHDDTLIKAADHLIEVGPHSGEKGGHIVYAGSVKDLEKAQTATAQYLNRALPSVREQTKPISRNSPTLCIRNANKHNIKNLSCRIPLNQFSVICGVSGSGKSTLLKDIIYNGLRAQRGEQIEDPANIKSIDLAISHEEILLIDQSLITKTPRSNPAIYSGIWDEIRQILADSPAARRAGFDKSYFSFNGAKGRCPQCKGLGFERIEMQFMSDVYVQCPECHGRRFRPEVLDIEFDGKSLPEILNMTIDEAYLFFENAPKVKTKLETFRQIGLGYLRLGQPLNTLSGGESQRLKLIKQLAKSSKRIQAHSLILIDEPTTGLHKLDIVQLIKVFDALITQGHTLVVVEHNLDLIEAADWVLEMGPESGDAGGKIVFEGPQEAFSKATTLTATFLQQRKQKCNLSLESRGEKDSLFRSTSHAPFIFIKGAREHNLKNIDLKIPHNQISLITGISGSGKSSLAFDIIFAEGQRRFMESISPWARQYVDQLPKPDIDELSGIPPSVAIEQRLTHGSSKSTVATITEIAQYLRLLYSRIGVPVSNSNTPFIIESTKKLGERIYRFIKDHSEDSFDLCLPVVQAKKGHHQPTVDRLNKQGYEWIYADGKRLHIEHFEKLNRYQEHDIDVVLAHVNAQGQLEFPPATKELSAPSIDAAEWGATISALLGKAEGRLKLIGLNNGTIYWFSSSHINPETGLSFPDMDPKNFSWNSPRGWCPCCHGHGQLYDWMCKDKDFKNLASHSSFKDGDICPECRGTRINQYARQVKLRLQSGAWVSLPELMQLTASQLLNNLSELALDNREQAIFNSIYPEIKERLQFMDTVGLDYISLDRSTATLSGGEAQRIRLAAQLSSNLSGTLYVLDEPSIGLHAKDSARVLESVKKLKERGNTIIMVEHDEAAIRIADHIVDLGPGAGIHGGHILAQGTLEELKNIPESLTGNYLNQGISHPLQGHYRSLPRKKEAWIEQKKIQFRNLKNLSIRFPLNRLIVVCGVSGAGKSSWLRDILAPDIRQAIRNNKEKINGSLGTQLINGNRFRKVIEVDQSPIGKTSRSTPATYLGIWDQIRKLFSQLPEARMHGFTSSDFSFNTGKGRCSHCKGSGQIKLEMGFMPDSVSPCQYCAGNRYGNDVQEIRLKEKSIVDVLNMSFEEAAYFFHFNARLHDSFKLMQETGLGYLKLGQPSQTLSGGEAQRLKLVSELINGIPSHKSEREFTQHNLYLLEEPTIGLHLKDCELLIHLMHRLVDQGHTLIVIEHHLDIIAEADYLIELGPGGGENGGKLLYSGSLKGLLKCKRSQTAPYLSESILGSAQ